MEPTVVNVEQVNTIKETENSTLRTEEASLNLRNAMNSLSELLGMQDRIRQVHEQLFNCFKICGQYLDINSLNEIKTTKLELVREALIIIDKEAALIETKASMHNQIREIIFLFGNDLKEVMNKVSTL